MNGPLLQAVARLNGAPAGLADLARLAADNYGHFTSMQVRGGAVRGLDLHFARLDAASAELFGAELSADRLRADLTQALGPVRDASVRISVIGGSPLDVYVVAGSPALESAGPIKVTLAEYERPLPAVKHAGTFMLGYLRRRARAAGYDDALFVDRSAWVSEGTVWNVAFFDGEQVVWPDAPMLRGITMQLMQPALAEAGFRQRMSRVHVDDVGSFRSAFAMNSISPVVPIAALGEVTYRLDDGFHAAVRAAYEAVAWAPVAG